MLVGLLAFGLYSIWDNARIDNENAASEYEMYKPTARDTRGYDDFRALNPDVCGWLSIDGTGIDYPLVQGRDNDEYMNKTPDLRFALSGSLFLDSQDSRDFSDFNTIIYGHHMEGPTMFGALDQYADASFFEGHDEGLLYYGGKWHELHVFAFLEVDAYDQGVYGHPRDKAGRRAYLAYLRGHAAQWRDVGADASSHLVVMSTCMNDLTNGRYVVVGKIGKVTAGPQEQGADAAASSGLAPWQVNLIFAVIAGLVVLALVALYLWLRRSRRRASDAQDAADAGGAAGEGSER